MKAEIDKERGEGGELGGRAKGVYGSNFDYPFLKIYFDMLLRRL